MPWQAWSQTCDGTSAMGARATRDAHPGQHPCQERALAGLRIVELGEGVSAPFCARLFADYGADVIKIETPRKGDRKSVV